MSLSGLLCVAVLVSGAVPAGAAQSAAQADAAFYRQLVSLTRMAGGPPGALAIVQRGARRTTFNIGYADVRTHRRIGPLDHWRTASVGKAFSGAAAMRLVDRGVMSLDDTIGERLPTLPVKWHAITLAELLHHTSGVPNFTAQEAFQKAWAADLRAPLSPMQILSYVVDLPLDFAPGTDYAYSNSDNIVVGLMIEQATGLTYAQVLSQRVLDPLRLRSTSLVSGYRMPARFVHGYDNNTSGPRVDISELINASSFGPAGGMASNPSDFTRFIRAYGSDGPFLKASTRARQRAWVPGASEPPGPGVNSAGLALFRYRTRCGTVYGHTGNFPGYTMLAASSADGRRSLVVAVNTHLDLATGSPPVFRALRRAEEQGVCAALASTSRFTG